MLGIAAAAFATSLSSKVYQSTGLVQVASDTPTGGAEVLGLQQASQDLASTYATLITSRSFLARIRPLVANGSHSVNYLAENVNARAVTQDTQNTNLIELSAKGPSPDEAKTLAQQVARAFVQTVSKDTQGRAQEQQKQFQIPHQRADRADQRAQRTGRRDGCRASHGAARDTRRADLGDGEHDRERRRS